MLSRQTQNSQPEVLNAMADGFLAYLVDQGMIDRQASDRADRAARETNEPLESLLVELGLLSESSLATTCAHFCRTPMLADEQIPLMPVGEDLFPVSYLKQARLLPVAIDDTSLVFATSRPLNNAEAKSAAYLARKTLLLCVVTESRLLQLFDSLYRNVQDGQVAGQTSQDVTADELAQSDLDRLRDAASDAPTVRLASRLIVQAVSMMASDIHIEPYEDRMRVRYRIDGALRTIDTLERTNLQVLVSRYKIMSNLNIAETRLPQDGRIRLPVKGKPIDIRVSTSPAQHGETMVLRILDRSEVQLDFRELGFDDAAINSFSLLISQPHGIILVTGPTGSGKTTTLYTALTQLNTDERKIFTVEDPIEYDLPGITQVQVKPRIGLDFATALRSILRQDPDIIMIGEIRDKETARIAVQASLTGHLVLATVHTNDAASAVTRLVDLGVEPYLLASTLRGVLAQRLVRKLCNTCKQPTSIPQQLSKDFRLGERQEAAGYNYEARGCVKCGNTGYSGRSTIYEILTLDDAVRRQLATGKFHFDSLNQHPSARYASMKDCGLAKVAAGLTSLTEILRVAGSD